MTAVGVIGAGYVGLTTAACLASLGHEVRCAEADSARLATLLRGEIPIHEAELETLVKAGLASGRLRFEQHAASAADGAEVVFLCVATPQHADGSADISQLRNVIEEIREILPSGCVVVIKSTIPIGSGDELSTLLARSDVSLAGNPEFLREGSAVRDFLAPDRIVVGATDAVAAQRVAALYAAIDAPVLITDIQSAQTIKYAANAMLAVRLSMVNGLAALCDATGADIDTVLRGLALDHRIGTAYLSPGPGWGGSCLPKDTSALVSSSNHAGVSLPVVEGAIAANSLQIEHIVEKVCRAVGGSLQGQTVALWGLTFKAGTDDLRESPALAVASLLRRAGAAVRAYDPTVAVTRADRGLDGLEIADSAGAVLKEADCLVVLTEWHEFAAADPALAASTMTRAVVVDARNVLDPALWKAAGFEYSGLGRR